LTGRPDDRSLVAMGTVRRLVAAMALVFAAVVGAPGVASADLPNGATWNALINDVRVDLTSPSPVRLEPGTPARVTVTIQNSSKQPVTARYVRLRGTLAGLNFFVYTIRVDLDVQPGEPGVRQFEIDLLDLGRQANGLLPARLALLDDNGTEIAGYDLKVDVRGDFLNVYSTFGIAVGLITLVLLVSALWRLATRRLHPNRWRRGLTMAAPGLGLGFFITFTMSALHLATPVPALWSSLLLMGAAIGFAAGYLSPNPTDPEDYPDGFSDEATNPQWEPVDPDPARRD
jgi:hypothetical protein